MCPLRYISDLRKKKCWIDNFLQIRVRILRKVKRNIIFFKNKFMRILKPESQAVNLVDFEQTNIRLCARVKVRPKDEIKEAAGDGSR